MKDDQKSKNDMTKTGKFCLSCNKEMEAVSDSNRYTCHWCGGIFEINEKGEVEQTWFTGFE